MLLFAQHFYCTVGRNIVKRYEDKRIRRGSLCCTIYNYVLLCFLLTAGGTEES
jgi:hypothetical protein